jgi:phage terminase small subunit
MGRRPHPTALKLLRGNPGKRPLNYREPQAPIGLGPPPAHLEPGSRAIWLELAPVLEQAWLGTVLDPLCLELLADQLADYRRFRRDPKHVAFAAGAWKRVVRLAVEFGLTPSSRARLLVLPAPGEADHFEKFLLARRPR